jgi:hypothetical protein
MLPLAVIVVFVVPTLAISVLASGDDVDGNNGDLEVKIISAPSEPVSINQELIYTLAFTDPGAADLTYTADWEWGDGNSSSCDTSPAGPDGPDECFLEEEDGLGDGFGSHTYTEAGIYTVDLTVTASDGRIGQPSSPLPVVVYDPEGGFVTGGGWINSPVGACNFGSCTDDTIGKATFGFVSKYKKGQSTPSGNTEFQFKAGDLNFHSEAYDWLVVNQNDSRDQFKGSGTINGQGTSKFMLWAGDGDPDTFRIRIWNEDGAGNETDVYDNGADQDIGGGNIIIHKAK